MLEVDPDVSESYIKGLISRITCHQDNAKLYGLIPLMSTHCIRAIANGLIANAKRRGDKGYPYLMPRLS